MAFLVEEMLLHMPSDDQHLVFIVVHIIHQVTDRLI